VKRKFTLKTLKNRKNYTESGGCRLSAGGGVFTPPRGV